MKIAIYSTISQLTAAVSAFSEFLGHPVETIALRRIADLHKDKSVDALILGIPDRRELAFKIVKSIRKNPNKPFIPVLLFLEAFDLPTKGLCSDLEYVYPSLSSPKDSSWITQLEKILTRTSCGQDQINIREKIATEFNHKNFKGIHPLIEKYIMLTGNEFKGHILKATLFYKTNSPSKAREEIMAAIKLNRNSIEARILLASVYQEMGKPKESEKTLKNCLKSNPNDVNILAKLGLVLINIANEAEANKVLKNALSIDPKNREVIFGIMALDILHDKTPEVKEKLEKYGILKSGIAFLNKLTINLAFANQFDFAEKIFKGIISITGKKETDYKIWMNLGLSAKKARDLNKALNFFEAASQCAPEGYNRAAEQMNSIKVMLRRNKS